MNQVSIGGTEITEDADVISVTGQFTITCIFDRILNDDGTPFTDEEMLKVGQDYISSENFRIGIDTNTDRYFLTDKVDDRTDQRTAAKLIQRYLITTFEQELKDATASGDTRHAVQVEADLKATWLLETYDDVKNFYTEVVRQWEPDRESIVSLLLSILVNEGEDT